MTCAENIKAKAGNWINEERIFNLKCEMVYLAYLDTLHPGFREHYSDGIVDAFCDYWNQNEKVDWVHAQTVVNKWLKPLLARAFPKGDSVCVCPKCGNRFKL